MYRTEEQWIDAYRALSALWIHDGKPSSPHALLTSGQHSAGFFNSRLVIADESLLGEAAFDLVQRFGQQGGVVAHVQGVVGPETGATILARLIRNHVCALTDGRCFALSPAKAEQDGVKSMVFTKEDLTFLAGNTVLLCEDVLTTGGSIELAAQAVVLGGGTPLPFVLTLVNRSGLTEINGKKIVALVNHPMPTWNADECPLCVMGSTAVRPKDNWAELTRSS